MATLTEEVIREAMKEVYDPEIPINVVDLGLVYGIDVKDNRVHVQMTLTAAGCGMGPYIARQAEERIAEVDGVEDVQVELVWDPPWNMEMISEDGRKLLGLD